MLSIYSEQASGHPRDVRFVVLVVTAFWFYIFFSETLCAWVGFWGATAGFQDVDIFQKAIRIGFEVNFECEFLLSGFRLQLSATHACVLCRQMIRFHLSRQDKYKCLLCVTMLTGLLTTKCVFVQQRYFDARICGVWNNTRLARRAQNPCAGVFWWCQNYAGPRLHLPRRSCYRWHSPSNHHQGVSMVFFVN